MAANITAVVVALIGFTGVALGIYFSRKGQKRSEESTAVAQTFATQLGIIDRLTKERDHLEERLEAERLNCRQELSAKQEDLSAMANALGTLRSIVDGQIAEAAAKVFDRDDPEGRERFEDFLRTMRQIGDA